VLARWLHGNSRCRCARFLEEWRRTYLVAGEAEPLASDFAKGRAIRYIVKEPIRQVDPKALRSKDTETIGN